MHKEAVLKPRPKPLLDEAYMVTGSIERKLATLQVMQQKLQADNSGAVTAQCTTEVVVIRVKLEGLHSNISTPTE